MAKTRHPAPRCDNGRPSRRPLAAVFAALILPALLAGADGPRTVETTELGRRATLVDDARLFVPTRFQPGADGRIDVVVHLHGAASVVEPALVDSGWPAVLVEFNRKGLSSVYAKPFSDPALLPRLLDDARTALSDLGASADPKIGRVVVSSFSAGFGGVREILKSPELVARIDGLVLADSLYCGYRGDPARREVDPDLMAGFRAFAREAADGRKTMLLTHSAQVPGTYASTTETADDLIQTVGAASRAESKPWADGWAQTRRAEKGRFEVIGFAGDGPADHMSHLRQIQHIWRRYRVLSNDRGAATPAPETRR